MLEVLQAGSWGIGLQSTPTTVFHPPRSIESPSLGFGADPFMPHLLEDEQGQLSDLEPELDSQNWQHTVGRELLASLPQKEIDRQEVINGEELGVRSWGSVLLQTQPRGISNSSASPQSSLPQRGLTYASSESLTSSSTSG